MPLAGDRLALAGEDDVAHEAERERCETVGHEARQLENAQKRGEFCRDRRVALQPCDQPNGLGLGQIAGRVDLVHQEIADRLAKEVAPLGAATLAHRPREREQDVALVDVDGVVVVEAAAKRDDAVGRQGQVGQGGDVGGLVRSEHGCLRCDATPDRCMEGLTIRSMHGAGECFPMPVREPGADQAGDRERRHRQEHRGAEMLVDVPAADGRARHGERLSAREQPLRPPAPTRRRECGQNGHGAQMRRRERKAVQRLDE